MKPIVLVALLAATPALCNTVIRVHSIVTVDHGAQIIELNPALCRIVAPAGSTQAIYSMIDGQLTMTISTIECYDRMFANGFELPLVGPPVPRTTIRPGSEQP